jgi:hypothetical protein
MTTWLYIIIVWADMAQPRPVPFPTMQACQKAAQQIKDTQSDFRTRQFMRGLHFYCVSTPPQDVSR